MIWGFLPLAESCKKRTASDSRAPLLLETMGLHALDSHTRPLFFRRRIHSRSESLKWTSGGQNGARGQHRMLRLETADPSLGGRGQY